MKLGKALATGVAEERPVVREEAPELPEEISDVQATGPVPEEVPVAR
ncbi:hypothetical protein [Streptomyces sp. NPDC057877]